MLVSGGEGLSGAAVADAEIYGTVADTTPPEVSCGAADGAWHISDVSIACTASDPESGLANVADTSFNLITNVPNGTETADAATNSRQVCNTGGNCTTAGPITSNKVDKKSPTITITSPLSATYAVGTTVGASYACGDAGAGVASCLGPVTNGGLVDTSSTGTKTFSVTATDVVGNPLTVTVTYNVLPPEAWTWSLTGSMDTNRHSHQANLLTDGRVLVSGGEGNGRVLAAARISIRR